MSNDVAYLGGLSDEAMKGMYDLNSNFINNFGLGIMVCYDGIFYQYASNQGRLL